MIAPSGIGRPVSALPPLAEVDERGQAVPRVREPRLVDDQPSVVAPIGHARHDLVERHDLDLRGSNVRGPESEQQIGGRPVAGDGHRTAGERCRSVVVDRILDEHQRAAAAPERTAAGQQLVCPEEPRQRRITDFDQVERTVERGRIGHVHVGIGHIDRWRAGDATVHEGIERECIVRAGRDGEGEAHAPNVPTASAAADSAVRASPIRHAARSRGPIRFEIVRTSTNRVPVAIAAHATPYPSIASTTASG